MNEMEIKVTIRSTYSIGATGGGASPAESKGDTIVQMEEGESVQSLLMKLPHIGSPDHWDDMMLIVIVNGTLRGFDHILSDGDVIDLHIPVSGG